MVVTTQQIEDQLKTVYTDATIKVEDVSGGCGAKFDIIIGSDSFEGVALLQRHRMVNETLGDLMKQIHAVNIKAWTMKQYNEKMKQ